MRRDQATCEEFVKLLRNCPDYNLGCKNCEFEHALGCRSRLVGRAADFIEELLRGNEELEESNEALANTLRDHDEMLHAYRHVCNNMSPDEVQKKLYFKDITTSHILEQYIPLFVPRWIEVKGQEPFPKDGQKVLVFAKWEDSEPVIDVAMFSLYEGTSDYGWKSEASNFWYGSDEISHWMPLPAPPGRFSLGEENEIQKA